MPQHHHQTFDQQGNLIAETIEEYVDVPPEPTDAERLDTLEAEVRGMRDRVAEVSAMSAEVRALRDAVTGGKGPPAKP